MMEYLFSMASVELADALISCSRGLKWMSHAEDVAKIVFLSARQCLTTSSQKYTRMNMVSMHTFI